MKGVKYSSTILSNTDSNICNYLHLISSYNITTAMGCVNDKA